MRGTSQLPGEKRQHQGLCHGTVCAADKCAMAHFPVQDGRAVQNLPKSFLFGLLIIFWWVAWPEMARYSVIAPA